MANVPASPARLPKTYKLLAALFVATLTTALITGFVQAGRASVDLVVDGQLETYSTEAVDVAGLLDQASVAISDGDLVNPSPDSPLSDGMTVTVRHAVPVTLELEGDSLALNVVGSTVADVLVSVGLDPARGLAVSPGIDEPLEAGMKISASGVFLRVMTEEVEIPFETRTVEDPTLPRGTQEVRTAGANGRLLRIFEVVVTDGVEGGRVLTAERVLAQPVEQVIAIGTKRAARQVLVSRGSSRLAVPPPPAAGEQLVVESSAYTPGYDAGITTATGVRAGFGIIAVDPSVIPLGTKLYVPGYGYGVAADTGGAIKGSRIDVCFDTLAQARAWGRRTVTVVIVD